MKVFILTTVMAPYRMKVFESLGKQCDLTVAFETFHDAIRNPDWYLRCGNNFNAIQLKKWKKGPKTIHWDALHFIKEQRPEVIVFYEYSTPTSIIIANAARNLKIPYMINCDGAFIGKKKIRDKIKRWMIHNAAGLMAGSESARSYFIHYDGDKKKIFHHHFTSLYEADILQEEVSVDTKRALRKKLGIQNKETILSVGNFVSGKGIKELLDIWENFDASYQLLVIGSGEEHGLYFEIIEGKHYKNVKILPFMQYSQLKEYYMAADLFVLNTKKDVWGLVVNEAMACGLPVLTTDKCNAGIELIREGSNGYIVQAGNEDEIVEKINAHFLRTDLQEMGKECLNTIRYYTIENIVSSHLESLKKMIEPYRSG